MYSLRLLGGVTLEGPSGPLSGPVLQKRSLALLAMLAASQGNGCSRGKLMAYLWPEHDEARARHLLANSVYVVRKALGDEAVQASGEYLRLNADIVGTDIADFAAAQEEGDLERAVALYAGPFMDGFHLSGAAEFDQWVESERRRLAGRYEAALESLAEQAEGAGDLAGAVGWWRQAAAHDPYNSRLVLRLMSALAQAGDPANAIQLAKDHERFLQEALGVEPPADLQAFVEQLMQEPLPPTAGSGPILMQGHDAAPQDRFATAGELGEVLRSPDVGWIVAAKRVAVMRRNVIAASAAGFVLLVLAVGVVLQYVGGMEFPFRPAAAGFVDPQDCVVVAEFENETERPALGIAVREAVLSDIHRSGHVTVLGPAQLRGTLSLMRLPDTTFVDEALALEIAQRTDCPAMVSGAVAPLGSGYVLAAGITETSTGAEVVRLSETAADSTEVVDATERLARHVRRHLGESLPSVQRSYPLSRHTTSSLYALEFFTRGRRRMHSEDYAGAIPLLKRAVELDTAFAEAYRNLGGAYNEVGDRVTGRRYMDLAYRHRDRLTLGERSMVVGMYHWDHGRMDSAVYYLSAADDRYPNYGAIRTNLGIALRMVGRFEEALQIQREQFETGSWWGHADNLVTTAQILHRHELADSALAFLRETRPDWWAILMEEQRNAYYRGDVAVADSLAREMANDSRATLPIRGRLLLAGHAAMYGRVNQALAQAGSAARLGFDTDASWWVSEPLGFIEYASLGADVPERALPLVEEFRSQLTLGRTVPDDEHWHLGRIACGYAAAGDVQSAREMLAVMDSLAEANDFHPSGIREQVLAVIAQQEERVEDAVDHLRRARAAEFGLHRWEVRLLLADALAALGQLPEAIAQYDTISGTYRMPLWDVYISPVLRPLAHERLGSLYLQVGDTVSAARHLTEFIELWKDADPELQPRVEEARRLLARLAADET